MALEVSNQGFLTVSPTRTTLLDAFPPLSSCSSGAIPEGYRIVSATVLTLFGAQAGTAHLC